MALLAALRRSTAVPVATIAVWLNGLVLDNGPARTLRYAAVRLSSDAYTADSDAYFLALHPDACGSAKGGSQGPCHAVLFSDSARRQRAQLRRNRRPEPQP